MSTPNPTHIDVIIEHAYLVEYGQVCCSCGWESETVNAESEHAAHVVSKLTDAGYSIIPSTPGTCIADPMGTHRWIPFYSKWRCADCQRQRPDAAAAEGEKP